MSTKLFTLALISALIVGLVGPAVMAADMKIGFMPMTLSNQYFQTMVEGAKKRASQLGVELSVQAPKSHSSVGAQLRIIENMITRGVDALCIVPASSTGLMSGLQKAQNAGIPVVNIDTQFSQKSIEGAGLNPIPYIGTDNYDGAKKAGNKALELLGGEGKVAILTGVPGQQNTRDRKNGFMDAVEGKLEIVATQTANWEVEEGYNVTQNILQANPDLGLIFASNDGMALGALRALKEAGKQDEIELIGYDAIPAALESVKAGGIDADVAQFPAEMGKGGVTMAYQMASGESIAVNHHRNTPTKLITQDNVDAMINYLENYSG